jgi:hypothetical protein
MTQPKPERMWGWVSGHPKHFWGSRTDTLAATAVTGHFSPPPWRVGPPTQALGSEIFALYGRHRRHAPRARGAICVSDATGICYPQRNYCPPGHWAPAAYGLSRNVAVVAPKPNFKLAAVSSRVHKASCVLPAAISGAASCAPCSGLHHGPLPAASTRVFTAAAGSSSRPWNT